MSVHTACFQILHAYVETEKKNEPQNISDPGSMCSAFFVRDMSNRVSYAYVPYSKVSLGVMATGLA